MGSDKFRGVLKSGDDWSSGGRNFGNVFDFRNQQFHISC